MENVAIILWYQVDLFMFKGIFSDSTTHFMTWIRRYKQKQHISKISVDSKLMFSCYAWLCVFHCSHRLLCWIKSCVRITQLISVYFFWSVLLRGELQKHAQKKIKIKFKKFWLPPLFNIRENAFKSNLIYVMWWVYFNLCDAKSMRFWHFVVMMHTGSACALPQQNMGVETLSHSIGYRMNMVSKFAG